DSAHFVVLPGHEIPDVEEIVEEHGTFNIIRKDPGGPAELARDLDERRQSSNRNEARRAGAIGARSARTQGAPIVPLSARPRTPRCARIARSRDTVAHCGSSSKSPSLAVARRTRSFVACPERNFIR